MRFHILHIVFATAFVLHGPADSVHAQVVPPWSDGFELYNTRDGLSTQSAWETWDDNHNVDALVVLDPAHTGEKSVRVADEENYPFGDTDAIMRFNDVTAGRWVVTAWQYVPSHQFDESYFILQHTYEPGGPYGWAVQVHVNAAAGTVIADRNRGQADLIADEWVELRVEIDLDEDWHTFYYGGRELYSGSWGGMEGPYRLQTLDLYANSTDAVFYDDISLVPAGGACCTGREKLKARCRGNRAPFSVKAALRRGQPDCPIHVCIDATQCREVTTNDRGKAKTKWITREAGDHTVSARTQSCGTPVRHVACGR